MIRPRRAALASAKLSLLFVLVYGSANALTALRHDVGTFYFEWERAIPFLPLMIVPYMSIDLFFVAAPFLCADEEELALFERRITLAILAAGAIFLAWPLRFSFPRPHTGGALGELFDGFRKMDQPFNQFPSLHIALRTLLADLYARHTRGVPHALVAVWFSLIGFSTLLTYQHHVVDVAGGAALAAVVLWLVRPEPLIKPVRVNPRAGALYAAGAALALALAAATWRAGIVFLWPATSLAIASAAYFGLGPGIFRKEGGRLPWSATAILFPLLLGQRLSHAHYRRRSDPWNEIAPGVWVGRTLDDAEAAGALRQGVVAVLDLTVEMPEAVPFRNADYLNLQVLDLTAPSTAQLAEAVAFLSERIARGVVYVHCKAGYSRSVAVAGAWLLASGEARTVDEAFARIRERRRGVVIRPEVRAALERFAAERISDRVSG